MDINAIRQLAGLPRLTTAPEPKKIVEQKLPEAKVIRENVAEETHLADPSEITGLRGMMITIDGKEGDALAKLLGIPGGWKLKTIGKGFVAYNEGDRLTFFTDRNDYQDE